MRLFNVVPAVRQLQGGTGTGPPGAARNPPLGVMMGLMEKFSTLSRAVGAADARPTASMVALFEDLSQRLEVQRNRLTKLVKEEVGPLLFH